MENTIEKYKKQHFNTYKNAIIDSIKNNTEALFNEDLSSLFKKPPLDSMDSIKIKFLDLAKKNKTILDTENLSLNIDNYRNSILKSLPAIKKERLDVLLSKVNKCNEDEVIKILKKDFNNINKKVKSVIKGQIIKSNSVFIESVDKVFVSNTEEEVKVKIKKDISKYIEITYMKQLLENVDIKILIKDTTLINLVKEQTERYLFTLSNSRLFNENI